MNDISVFCSYSRKDDEHDDGAIVYLANQIKGEYEALTGYSMNLFLDKEDIGWGSAWELAIETGLEGSGILLAFLSPQYFASPNCRGELQTFLNKVESTGAQKLILPLEYIDVPNLKSGESGDELMERVRRIQIEQWSDARFFERKSGKYRRRVSLLASKIVEANAALDEMYQERSILNDAGPKETCAVEDSCIREDGSEKGLFDNLAEYVDVMEEATTILGDLSNDIAQIGGVAEYYAEKLEQARERGNKPSAYLSIFKQMSQKLNPIAQELESGCSGFYRRISGINSQVRLIIDYLNRVGVQEAGESENDLTSFKGQILFINRSAQEAVESTRKMDESISETEGFSRDLNVPVRTIRSALHTFEDATNLIDGWAKLCETDEE